MWMQDEDSPARDPIRTAIDGAHAGIAVFDRPREFTFLEWRAHPKTLAVRHASRENERLGATADATEERLHHDFVVRGSAQRLAAYLSPARLDDPERSRFVGHAATF
jgi:hypothetical protein